MLLISFRHVGQYWAVGSFSCTGEVVNDSFQMLYMGMGGAAACGARAGTTAAVRVRFLAESLPF